MRVTIGVPFYNVGEVLLDCVRSVFAQTEQEWELLLVDDGSTDNSLEIAQSIDDPRIRVVSDGRNLGLAARLNQIAELAQGEFLARQDADDLMHPERLSDQIAYLVENPSYDAIGSPWYSINSRSFVIGRSGNEAIDLSMESVLRRTPLSHGTVVGRRDWWRRLPYSQQLRRSQDRNFWIRAILFEKSQVALLEQPRYFYRILESVPLLKTLEGYRNERRILREFGPPLIGRWRTAKCVCRSYTKSAIWWTASSMQSDKWLSRERSERIDISEQRIAQQIVDQIRSSLVPIRSMAPAAVCFDAA